MWATDVPHPDRFAGKDYAIFEILHGTKGERRPNDPDNVGKSRKVRVKADFVELMYAYNKGRRFRPAALARFETFNPGEAPPKQLFLNPKTGRPYTVNQLNRVFALGENRPMEHFTPHVGRHFYACWTLLEFVHEQLQLSGYEQGSIVHGLAESFANTALLRLQAHLGHAHKDTTDLYVTWVSEFFRLNGWRPAL